MLVGIAAVFIAAQPVSLFVENFAVSGGDPSEASTYARLFADELRRYGLRVTTHEQLTAVLSGKRVEQLTGCEDKDCGVDKNVIANADGIVKGTAVIGDGELSISVDITDVKAKDVWNLSLASGRVSASPRDPAGGMRELVATFIEPLRKRLGADRISPTPLKEPPGAPVAPRRCSASGAETALALAAGLAISRAIRSRRR